MLLWWIAGGVVASGVLAARTYLTAESPSGSDERHEQTPGEVNTELLDRAAVADILSEAREVIGPVAVRVAIDEHSLEIEAYERRTRTWTSYTAEPGLDGYRLEADPRCRRSHAVPPRRSRPGSNDRPRGVRTCTS